MPFWRKKNDGFEWREYVRTTILLRRQERRQKIEDVKAAAIGGAREGGRAGLEAASAGLSATVSGLRLAAGWTAERFVALAHWLMCHVGIGVRRAWAFVSASVRDVSIRAGPRLASLRRDWAHRIEPAARSLGRPEIALPLKLIGAVAAVAAVTRIFARGFDTEALLAGAIAIVMGLLTIGPRLLDPGQNGTRPAGPGFLSKLGEHVVLLPGFDRMRPAPAALLASVLLLALVTAGLLWTPLGSAPGLSALPQIPVLREPPLEGRATAESGDTVRMAGRRIRLQGIEAPEADQFCSKPGTKRWRCGAAARDALARALRDRKVACTVSSEGIGSCRTGETDIAAELVRGGHVFAAAGLFAPFSAEEREAREKKAGLWAGEAERPDDWRARRWEEARRAAPEGCPIKGEISSGARRYLLPWTPGYDAAKITPKRGERWFCSEDEAVAAGWSPKARL